MHPSKIYLEVVYHSSMLLFSLHYVGQTLQNGTLPREGLTVKTNH